MGLEHALFHVGQEKADVVRGIRAEFCMGCLRLAPVVVYAEVTRTTWMSIQTSISEGLYARECLVCGEGSSAKDTIPVVPWTTAMRWISLLWRFRPTRTGAKTASGIWRLDSPTPERRGNGGAMRWLRFYRAWMLTSAAS